MTIEEELKVLRPKLSPLNQVMALILASFSLCLKLRCQIKFLLKHAFIFNGKKQAISKSDSSTLSLIYISRGNQSSSRKYLYFSLLILEETLEIKILI